jgi:hypothetical protein
VEFLIRRTDGEWFDLPRDRFEAVFRPPSRQLEVAIGAGDLCLLSGATSISIVYDDPGLHVTFRGPMPEEEAVALVEEFCERVCAETGQAGSVVPL